MKSSKMKILFLILPILLFSGCFSLSFKGSINNVWKVPNTNLSIAVEKEKAGVTGKEVTRRMILRENYSDKNKILLGKGMSSYSRINIYQIGEHEYVLQDVYETFGLNAQSKTLTKTSPAILTATFENSSYPKFIGAFDDNENSNWRYIPVSERAEIPLTAEIK